MASNSTKCRRLVWLSTRYHRRWAPPDMVERRVDFLDRTGQPPLRDLGSPWPRAGPRSGQSPSASAATTVARLLSSLARMPPFATTSGVISLKTMRTS